MNVAKNKKSTFINLFEVLSDLQEDELKRFSDFLKQKRKVTNNNKLLNEVVSLIKNNESVETINKTELKKKVEKKISSNFDKLTENLYSRLLSFLSELYKEDTWKKWQIEANNSLLEIEALCNRELYSQAIAHILKLEQKLKEKGQYQEWFYDDIGIYSRLANLKIGIITWANDLITIDENDEVLNNLLMLGDYFYNNKLSIPNEKMLMNHKFVGYQLLSQYFATNKEYQLSIDAVDQILKNIDAEELAPEAVDLVYDYYNLVKMFLYAKYKNTSYHYEKRANNKTGIINALLQEQLIKAFKTSTSPIEKLLNNSHDEQTIIDSLFFTQKKIEHIPDRLELNRAIIFYLNNEFEKCHEIILELKSLKRNKKKTENIFLDLLFLDLLSRIKKGEYDLESIFRSLDSSIKARRNPEFEKFATKLLRNYVKLTPSGKREFPYKEKENLNKLMNLKDSWNPVHRLILLTLNGEV